MVHSDVGVRCKNCAPDVGRGMAMPGGGRSVIGLGVLVLGGLVVAGAVGSGVMGRSNDNDPYSFTPEWDYDVAVNEVQDPWTEQQPSNGYRLVAVDVTVSADDGNEEPYYTGLFDFKLTDSENFAYGASSTGELPMFPADVSLEPGEKVRGWVTFEVAENNDLKSLTSYEEVIPLSD